MNFHRKIKQNLTHTLRTASSVTALVLVIASQPLMAISEGELFQNEAFLRMFAAVYETNNAMKIAAANPMDKWRRQAVREAIQKIPPALIGLAESFESGKLHDGDYQYVMGLLGGFVDQKSAPQIYAQFMKKPSMDLIPKASGAVQARLNAGGSAPSGKLYYDESAPSPNEQKLAGSSGPSVPSSNREVVNLSAIENYDSQESPKASGRLYFDEGAAAPSMGSVAGASNSAASNGGFNSASNSGSISGSAIGGGSTEVKRTIASDVAASAEPAKTELTTIEPDSDETPVADSKSKQKNARKSKRTATPQEFKKQKPRSSLDSLNLRAQVLKHGMKLWSVFGYEAHAQEGSNCGSCQKGGQGGGGEGGGGGGGGGGAEAAQLLFGLAAVMAAAVPAIVASEQADADKEIARTNAEAQKYMTDSVAANSEALAQMQAQTAAYQTDAQVASVQASNAATSQRLGMQLAQLETSQARIAMLEQQQFQAEQELNQKRLQLSEQQLQANLAAAQAAQNLQITQAGLSLGSTPGNSGTTLTVAQAGVATASTQAATGLGGATAANTTVGNASTGSAQAFLAPRNSNVGRGPASGSAGASVVTGVSAAGVESGQRAVSGSGTGPGAVVNAPSDTFRYSEVKHGLSNASTGSGSAGASGSASSESGGSSFASGLFSSVATPADRLTVSGGSLSEGASNFQRAVAGEPQVLAYLQSNRDLNGWTRAARSRALRNPASGDLKQFIAAAGTAAGTEPQREATESFAQFQSSPSSVMRGIASTSGPAAGHGHGGHTSAVTPAVGGRGIAAGRSGRPAAEAYNPPNNP
jgi:hypothetical protein